MNTTCVGYFCLGKTLSSSKNNISCCTTDQGLAWSSKCEIVIITWCLLFWRRKEHEFVWHQLPYVGIIFAVSAASLHVLPLSHSLCLPVTLFSSWLVCLSPKPSAADVNRPRQDVLFATCVATCVTMGEVLFSFFPGHLFISASVSLLIFHTLKVYYTCFPLGSWCPPCRGHVQSSKTTLL